MVKYRNKSDYKCYHFQLSGLIFVGLHFYDKNGFHQLIYYVDEKVEKTPVQWVGVCNTRVEIIEYLQLSRVVRVFFVRHELIFYLIISFSN